MYSLCIIITDTITRLTFYSNNFGNNLANLTNITTNICFLLCVNT